MNQTLHDYIKSQIKNPLWIPIPDDLKEKWKLKERNYTRSIIDHSHAEDYPPGLTSEEWKASTFIYTINGKDELELNLEGYDLFLKEFLKADTDGFGGPDGYYCDFCHGRLI